MDEISKINRLRWNNLADAQVEYSRPFLSFTIEDAKKYVYRHGILEGCGREAGFMPGQRRRADSVAFGLLGADVTVLDLSDVQLERDRQAAAYMACRQKPSKGICATYQHFRTTISILSGRYIQLTSSRR